MLRFIRSIAVVGAMLSVAPIASAVTITVSTTQAGANTQIDEGSSMIWNFGVTAPTTVDTIIGSFIVKEGANTDAPLIFGLFSGSGATGTALATASVSHGTIGQSFQANNPVLFTLNFAISEGSYSLKLYSAAGSKGSKNWFFKGQGGDLYADPCDGLTGVLCGTSPPAVPEPGTLALLGLGLVGLGLSRRRNT